MKLMKKKITRQFLCLCTAAFIGLTAPASAVRAALSAPAASFPQQNTPGSTSLSTGTASNPAGTAQGFTGWKKNAKSKKRYYINGKKASGLIKLKKKTYYFKKGIPQTGEVKLGKKKYYYFDDKGVLEGYKIKSKYYKPNGKKMDSIKARDFEALQNARKTISQITGSGMSKSEKLETCFRWIMNNPYTAFRPFSNQTHWPSLFANDHFKNGRGDCISDASAFAYMAKALGYKNVYVCADSSNNSAHSWAEINGRVYDPLFAQVKGYSRNYGSSYATYGLYYELHVKI